jgi:amino acid transporter
MSEVNTPGAGATAGVAPEGMFVRQSTGLVRQIGGWQALSLAIGAIAIGGGFIAFFFMLAVFPHANMYIAWILGGAALVALGLVYIQLIQTMPRTGGDYVFAGRLVHPALGAAVGGGLFFFFALFPAFWAFNFASTHFPAFVQELGSAIGWDAMVGFSDNLGANGSIFGIGLILVLVLAAIAMYSTRWGYWVLGLCFLAGLAVLAIGLIVLAANSNSDFVAAFDAQYGAGAYQGVIDAAKPVGYDGGYTFTDTLLSLPWAALWMWGVAFAAYPGGELRNVGRTVKISILGSAAITIAYYLIMTGLANRTLGVDFMAAGNFLSLQHSDLFAPGDAPSMTAYTGILTGNGFLDICIALIGPFTEIGIIMTYLLTTSRILFAFSFDRLLPPQIIKVSRNGTPVVAIAIIALSILVAFTFATYTTYLGVIANGTLGLACVYVVISALPIVLIYRHRRLYESGPRFLAQKLLGLPAIVWVAGISTIFNICIVILAIVKPLGLGPMTWKSGLATVIAFTWAVALYYGVKGYYKTRGLNIDPVLKEIPAE